MDIGLTKIIPRFFEVGGGSQGGINMQGILKEVKKTQNRVFFEIVATQPAQNEDSVEYFLLSVKGQGVRYARKLLGSEMISDFPASNLLFSDDNVVYILPDVFIDTKIIKAFFKKQ
ncbi:MAG: hypothetical protein H6Q70_77 [Firmicutes bacterium]|nr:hypothetical protein [Bacillota bacterium]